MFVVVKRTWSAGADPTDAPDAVRTLSGGVTREAAMRKAELRATRAAGLGTASHDPETDSWWVKAPSALHQFVVVETHRRR